MSFNKDRAWKSWEKIIFRLLFPFLILQILTQDFTGNLFGGSWRVCWEGTLYGRIFCKLAWIPPGDCCEPTVRSSPWRMERINEGATAW
ncbi:MAG: hypothetical protein J0H07_14245 [Sphingobacteriales bacterium]|nr:hypothetical protein [Sphingobacteriales bacterium]